MAPYVYAIPGTSIEPLPPGVELSSQPRDYMFQPFSLPEFGDEAGRKSLVGWYIATLGTAPGAR